MPRGVTGEARKIPGDHNSGAAGQRQGKAQAIEQFGEFRGPGRCSRRVTKHAPKHGGQSTNNRTFCKADGAVHAELQRSITVAGANDPRTQNHGHVHARGAIIREPGSRT